MWRGQGQGGRTHSHRKQPSSIMPHLKRLVRKRLRPVDGRAPRPIPVDEVPALHHEVLDHAVELAALVPLRPAEVVLRLARAELAEVLGGAGGGRGEELHFDAAEGFAGQGEVEEDYGVGLGVGHCGYRCFRED